MAAIEYGPQTTVVLEGGSITADQVVLAINAWAAQIPEIGAGLVVVASDVIATEAVPERLADAGIKPGVCISDGRQARELLPRHHGRPDGVWQGRRHARLQEPDHRRFDHPGGREPQIRSQLLRTYPALWDVPIAEAWSGPIDYSLSGLPFFVRLREAPSVLVCAGFSGDGVGPSRLAGEILAEMVADGGNAGLPEALRTVPTRLAAARADALRRRPAGARRRSRARSAARIAALSPTSRPASSPGSTRPGTNTRARAGPT